MPDSRQVFRYSMKFPISTLPLVPKSQLLINHLTPDTHTPNPHHFRTKVLTETPSLQRRARVYVISFLLICHVLTISATDSFYKAHVISLMYLRFLCHFLTR